ncbi:hypothetical protein WDW89_18960, partial [Deltaproteobacteria bacterium TL4]
TVTGVADTVPDNNQSYSVILAVSSSDNNYNHLNSHNLSVINEDNKIASLPDGSSTVENADGSKTITYVVGEEGAKTSQVVGLLTETGASITLTYAEPDSSSVSSEIQMPQGALITIQDDGSTQVEMPLSYNSEGNLTQINAKLSALGEAENTVKSVDSSEKTFISSVKTEAETLTTIQSDGKIITVVSSGIDENLLRVQNTIDNLGTTINLITATTSSGTFISEIITPVGSKTSVNPTLITTIEIPPFQTKSEEEVFVQIKTDLKSIIQIKITAAERHSLLSLYPGATVAFEKRQGVSYMLMTTPLPFTLLAATERQLSAKGKRYLLGQSLEPQEPLYVVPNTVNVTLRYETELESGTTQVTLITGDAEYQVGSLPSQTWEPGNSLSLTNPATIKTFVPGLNLAALPFQTELHLETQFTEVKTVWVFQKQQWKAFTPSLKRRSQLAKAGIEEIKPRLEAGEGFWVEMPPFQSMALSMVDEGSYELMAQVTSVTAGWYLLGSGSQMSTETLIQTINQRIQAANEHLTQRESLLGGGLYFGVEGPSSPLLLFILGSLLLLLAIRPVLQAARFPQAFAPLFISAILILVVSTCALEEKKGNSDTSAPSSTPTPVSTTEPTTAPAVIPVPAAATPAVAEPLAEPSASPLPLWLHSLWKWDTPTQTWQVLSPHATVSQQIEQKAYPPFQEILKGEGFWLKISQDAIPL